MKHFAIVDMVNNNPVCLIDAKHGKSALQKFKLRLMSSGFYEIRKEAGFWILCSSFGSYFKAIETH